MNDNTAPYGHCSKAVGCGWPAIDEADRPVSHDPGCIDAPKEHVILVAFAVEAASREEAEARLVPVLPRPGTDHVDSWWVAEDDRHDGSDNDSAVFVTPGHQESASRLLAGAGLTPVHNVVVREAAEAQDTPGLAVGGFAVANGIGWATEEGPKVCTCNFSSYSVLLDDMPDDVNPHGPTCPFGDPA